MTQQSAYSCEQLIRSLVNNPRCLLSIVESSSGTHIPYGIYALVNTNLITHCSQPLVFECPATMRWIGQMIRQICIHRHKTQPRWRVTPCPVGNDRGTGNTICFQSGECLGMVCIVHAMLTFCAQKHTINIPYLYPRVPGFPSLPPTVGVMDDSMGCITDNHVGVIDTSMGPRGIMDNSLSMGDDGGWMTTVK